ncbi:MAG: alpha/beta fold hydrolase [Acidimicrobiia bacterium]|nr:alpha/beta fold hydrolase [Acidimicrobiia bacterium]MDH5236376.1 alpha/beta fold hydrolase [Acidimicrobiia bacterium]
MPQISANGLTFAYDERGEGEPLLLVMGLGTQMIAWREAFMDQLVELGFRVIRFDNRDVGLSSRIDADPPDRRAVIGQLVLGRRPDAAYLLADMADDAAGLLDALDIDSAHIVGASMGGMITQQLAIDHPKRVRSICSIMSNTGDRRNGRIAPALLLKGRKLLKARPETAVEDAVAVMRLISGPHFDEAEVRVFSEESVERAYDPAGQARQTAAIAASPDRTEALAHVRSPALVIHGMADPLVRFSGGVATARAVPGARMLAFPDMAHDLPRPRWGEMTAAIAANAARAAVPVAASAAH